MELQMGMLSHVQWMHETLPYTYLTVCVHISHKRVCAFIPLGQLCTPPNTHLQCRYKQDKWTDKHRSVQTGKQTDTHTHAGSQYWATPQTWHPLGPSRGHLKGLKANSPSLSFVLWSLSLPPSFCPSFGLCPNNQSCWWLCFQLSQTLFLHHHFLLQYG